MANPKKEVITTVRASGIKRYQAWFNGSSVGEFDTAHQAQTALNHAAQEWLEANR